MMYDYITPSSCKGPSSTYSLLPCAASPMVRTSTCSICFCKCYECSLGYPITRPKAKHVRCQKTSTNPKEQDSVLYAAYRLCVLN